MTTSITENREPSQATATAAGKPEPPKNAKVAAPKPRVASAKAKWAKKATSAKKAVKAARQATTAKADRVRQGSKTAQVLELVKAVRRRHFETPRESHRLAAPFRARLPFHLGHENGPEDRVPQN